MGVDNASVIPTKWVDPSITANIYASGMLDDVVLEAIFPFWVELERSQPSRRNFLWLMRYARRGEHLKIRVHCAPAAVECLKVELSRALDAWIERQAGVEAVDVRCINPNAPAIDVEDDQAEPHPDRSFLWTQYRRTHVSLPGSPWLNDDTFAGLAYRCLSESTNVVMRAFAERRTLGDGDKQSLLAKSLIGALDAAGLLSPALAGEYFRFHRDWLLRFFVRDSSKETEIRARFSEQADRSAARASLLTLAERVWRHGSPDPWPSTLQHMVCYVGQFEGNPEYQIDPFTSNIAFPPLFKMFHGMANQLGVLPFQEAYVHHLLASVVDKEGAAYHEDVQGVDRHGMDGLVTCKFDAQRVEQRTA